MAESAILDLLCLLCTTGAIMDTLVRDTFEAHIAQPHLGARVGLATEAHSEKSVSYLQNCKKHSIAAAGHEFDWNIEQRGDGSDFADAEVE